MYHSLKHQPISFNAGNNFKCCKISNVIANTLCVVRGEMILVKGQLDNLANTNRLFIYKVNLPAINCNFIRSDKKGCQFKEIRK